VFTDEPPDNSQNDRVYAPVGIPRSNTPIPAATHTLNIQLVGMVSVAVSTMGMTELIFFDPRVKVNRQYYCDVLLSQQMLPAINRVAERCLFTSSVLLTAKFVIFVFCDFPR